MTTQPCSIWDCNAPVTPAPENQLGGYHFCPQHYAALQEATRQPHYGLRAMVKTADGQLAMLRLPSAGHD